MPTTAWKSPSATAQLASGDPWSNPTNAYSISGTVSLGPKFGGSELRSWTGFGFTTTDIPSGATIDGIEVRWRNALETDDWTELYLVVGGSTTGNSKYTDLEGWTSTATDRTSGGSSDTWGATLSDSDVRSSGFGVAMEKVANSPVQMEAAFDQIEIRVTYTAGSTTISGSGAATTAAATASGAGTVATPEITWDTAASPGSISFSDGDRTATYNSTSGNPVAIATNSASSGKVYFEVEVGGSADANYYAGIAPSSVGPLGGYTDADLTFVVRTNGQVWGGGSNIATVGSFSAGDILGFAVDLDADDAWVAINGVWQNSGDPGAGTNGITITGGTEFPVTCPRNGSTTLHADSSTWNYSAPSGFSQLPTTATISGSGAATIAAVTASGTAERTVTGSGAATIGAVTADGSGSAFAEITGSGAATIGAVTASGTAERSITGTGAATVASITASGTAEREIVGSGAATIAAVTASGSGSVAGNVTGTGAATIASVTASGTAERTITGTGAATTAAATASGTAERVVTGSGSATVGALTASGSGEVSGNITGTGAATIAAVTASGTAERTVTGAGAATIAAVTASGTAERVVIGTGAATIGAVTASGTGALSGEVTGSGAATIAAVTASGTAERTVTGAGAATFGAVTADGTAAVQGPITGTGAAEIAPVEASGTATRIVTGSGAATIAAVEASGGVREKEGEFRQPGGFIKPIIYLDRDGNPMDLEEVAEAVEEAVQDTPPKKRKSVRVSRRVVDALKSGEAPSLEDVRKVRAAVQRRAVRSQLAQLEAELRRVRDDEDAAVILAMVA